MTAGRQATPNRAPGGAQAVQTGAGPPAEGERQQRRECELCAVGQAQVDVQAGQAVSHAIACTLDVQFHARPLREAGSLPAQIPPGHLKCRDLHAAAAGGYQGQGFDTSAQQRFAALKDLRNQLRDGKPAYVVFDNKTLVAIARQAPTTTSELAKISGVGPAKLDKYGTAVTELMASLL